MSSTANISFEETKFINTENGIIFCGKIITSPHSIKSIDIPTLIDNDFNIILNKNIYQQFKLLLYNAPNNTRAFNVYDHLNFLICSYAIGDNRSGTVEISTDSYTYLHEIKLPLNDIESIIPITSYPALSCITLEENQHKLISKDVELWLNHIDGRKVHIFISILLYQMIKRYFVLSPNIKFTIVDTTEKIITTLIEYICGPTIPKSIEKFQSMLKFDNANIINIYSKEINDKEINDKEMSPCVQLSSIYQMQPSNVIELVKRRGDKIHINGNGVCQFIIVLKNIKTPIVKIKESTTGKEFEFDITDIIYTSKSQDNIINEYIELTNYYNKLINISYNEEKRLFINSVSNINLTMKYLFTDCLSKINKIKKTESNEYIKLVINDYIMILSYLQNMLTNLIISCSEYNINKIKPVGLNRIITSSIPVKK